jgi:hypothetical protein
MPQKLNKNIFSLKISHPLTRFRIFATASMKIGHQKYIKVGQHE